MRDRRVSSRERFVNRLIRQQKFERAEALAARWHPKGYLSEFTYANIAYRQGFYDLAAHRMLDALEEQPSSYQVASRLATAAIRTKNKQLMFAAINALASAAKVHSKPLATLGATIEEYCEDDEYREEFAADLIEIYSRALTIEVDDMLLHARGRTNLVLGYLEASRKDLAKAVLLKPSDMKYRRALLSAHREDPIWKRLEILEEGLTFAEADRDWQLKTADARFNMHRYLDAAELYAVLDQEQPEDGVALKNVEALILGGRLEDARNYYSARRPHFRSERWKQNGLGAFLQSREYWPEAAREYEVEFRRTSTPAAAHRCGYAYLRALHPERALPYLQRASRDADALASWIYHEALCLERTGKMVEAVRTYLWAHLRAKSEYPLYRAVYVARAAGLQSEVKKYLDQRLNKLVAESADVISRESEYDEYAFETAWQRKSRKEIRDRATVYLQNGELHEARRLFTWLRDTEAVLDPYNHKALALALLRLGYVESALEAYLGSRAFWGAHGLDDTNESKHSTYRQRCYIELQEELAVDTEKVLYEANHGGRLTCNVLPLLKENLRSKRGRSQLHVVVLDPFEAPGWANEAENVIFVARESHAYLRHLATAGWLINNNTFPPYFSRRDGQKYLNTWHGTPLKALGRDIRSGTMDHRNAARNFLHATHMIFPNMHTANVLIDRYDISGIYAGKAALTGYPRIDSTVNATEERIQTIRHEIGAKGPVVLYAPTWRGTLRDRYFDVPRLVSDLKSLSELPITLVFQSHPLIEEFLDVLPEGVRRIPEGMDINEFLAVADILVTDYSSVLFDYYSLNRPVIIYAHDQEQYFDSRGAYFDLDDLPGTICRTSGQLLEAIGALASEPGRGLRDARIPKEEFVPMEDGRSTARVLNFFFNDDSRFEISTDFGRPKKAELLFHQGSFIPNGITSSFQALATRLIESKKYNITVVLQPEPVFENRERLEKYHQLPAEVRTLGRVGDLAASFEESWSVRQFNRRHTFFSDDHRTTYMRAFTREYRRLFGASKFDHVVCFEGYARFWISLFGAGADRFGTKSHAYMHSDMWREYKARFPYLAGVFSLYRYFDKLASVSKSVEIENRKQLCNRFNIPAFKMVTVTNLIDPPTIRKRGKEGEKFAASVINQRRLFVSTGRVTREKGHDLLLSAFAHVAEERDDCLLAIIGDGPLLEALRAEVEELGLSSRVLTPGYVENPLGMVAQADCFVFPSRYEGQGLALVEALVLGIPSIGCDVVGVRSVLGNGEGVLVPPESKAIAEAMSNFLDRRDFEYRGFDVDHYVAVAFQEFEELLA